ncbi:MAG: undecaprenyl-diphosphate phosphatase [Pseudomonadota bacterium]
MPLIQLIVLAIIQGITEFLPVSSSAHLILAPIVVDGWADQGALIDIAAHVGSLGAVIAYFRSESMMLIRGGFDTVLFRESAERKLFLFIAGATIPIMAVAGVFFVFDLVDALRSLTVIGLSSIVFGVLLWLADRAPATKDGLDRIGWREVMTIGAAQSLAVIPGVSRSGVTMTAARYLGWTRSEAARFSMLLAIPTILAFGLVAGLDLASDGAGASAEAAAIVAVLSFAAAFASIAVFMRLMQRISMTPFVIYRVLLGLAALAFAGMTSAG